MKESKLLAPLFFEGQVKIDAIRQIKDSNGVFISEDIVKKIWKKLVDNEI